MRDFFQAFFLQYLAFKNEARACSEYLNGEFLSFFIDYHDKRKKIIFHFDIEVVSPAQNKIFLSIKSSKK